MENNVSNPYGASLAVLTANVTLQFHQVRHDLQLDSIVYGVSSHIENMAKDLLRFKKYLII